MLLETMASDLGVEAEYAAIVARTASHRYKEYTIEKRSGGTRAIHHPSAVLKAFQRWIAINVLPVLPVHAAAHAYVRGCDIKRNALVHAASRFLLRLDFKDFFPSLTSKDVVAHLNYHRGLLPRYWSDDDTALVAAFATREGALPIGAPTSPSLSNSICFELDTRLHAFCQSNNASYTRYADDLFFSCSKPHVLAEVEKHARQVLSELRYPKQLTLNGTKTRRLSKRHRRVVTGLVLGSDGHVSIGRAKKRAIRSLIHRCSELTPAQRNWLAGTLAFCKAVEPEFINRLIVKYGIEVIDGARTFATEVVSNEGVVPFAMPKNLQPRFRGIGKR